MANEPVAAVRARIDRLERAIRHCPEDLWGVSMWEVKPHHPGVRPADGSGGGRGAAHLDDGSIQVFSAFWYIAYHALFFLDYYLSGGVDEGFAPPAPFRSDEHTAGALPKRVYTRAELQDYLEHNRQKCGATIEALTDEQRGAQPHAAWLSSSCSLSTCAMFRSTAAS